MSKIKICGLFRECDIDYVNEAKPDYAGFIINFERSHRSIGVETAKSLRERLDKNIKAVGVFVDLPKDDIFSAADIIGLDIIQLHGHEDDEYINAVKEKTALLVWKAFKIREDKDLKDAIKSRADMVLLDNGYGTGKAFDHSLIRDFKRPFILAGGLTPENITEAILRCNPKILDISSGVETDKVKDLKKILRVTEAVRKEALLERKEYE